MMKQVDEAEAFSSEIVSTIDAPFEAQATALERVIASDS